MYERINLNTDSVAALVPGPKEIRVKDQFTRGLMLTVLKSGRKVWRYRYMIDGRSVTMDGGTWPQVSVDAAREWAKAQAAIRASGADPIDSVIATTPGVSHHSTFEKRAREWHTLASKIWSEQYRGATLMLLERDVFNAPLEGQRLKFGQMKLDAIKPWMVLQVVRVVEDRGTLDVAADVCRLIGQVFKWAIVSGLCDNANPAADVPSQLQKRTRTNFAALRFKELAKFMSDLDAYRMREHIKIGLELMILLAPRTDELREAKWSEVDFVDRTIRIGAERMKDRQARRKATGEYLIPMSDHVVDLLKRLHAITGHGELLFPGLEMGDAISNGTWLQALKRMGYRNKATVHGFRATFATAANEAGFQSKIVDRQLDHVEKDQTSAAYNRSEYLDLRRELMQWWTDQVLRAKGGATNLISKRNYEATTGADDTPAPSKSRAKLMNREAIAADFF